MPEKFAKQVLYLTYDGLTDPLGQSQVLPYLLALEREGFSFHVVSFEKPLALLAEEKTIRHLIKNRKISWYPQVYHKSPPIASAVYDLWKMKAAAERLLDQFPISISWCRSYLPALVGLALSRKHGVPFIFDMRGFWPDERVEGGSWRLSNPLYRMVYNYFKRKEKELLAEAAHVVVLTEKARNILLQGELQGVVPAAVSVVPCCVDADHFNPDAITEPEKQRKRKALGLAEDDKVLVYAGSLGTWYLVGDMLRCFGQLREQDSRWKFLVVSKDDPQRLLRQAAGVGLPPDVVKIVAASRKDMPLLLSLGHLAISFIMPVFSKQASSPTKLAEYMAMGLPVVCNKGVGDVDEILRMSGAGYTIELAESFSLDACKLPEGQKIRAAALTHFSLPKGLYVYKKLLAPV